VGAEGVHGEDDEQGGEHEPEALDAAEQRSADKAVGQRPSGPGGVQAELGPQDAAAGERLGVLAGGQGIGLIAECEDAVGLAVPSVDPVQREGQPRDWRRNLLLMDALDRAIVGLLKRDGRLTNQELAAQVGLTPPPACAGSAGWKPTA
jgi:hypothetical protein